MADFATLDFQRNLRAAPNAVFAALVTAEARAIWGAPDEGFVVQIIDPIDAAPGLREISRVGPADNPYVTVHTDWIVIEAPLRLVYAETLLAEEETLGVTLAIAELSATEGGTQLDLHLDLTSFGGAEVMDEVQSGWTHALDNFAKFVEAANV